MKVQYSQVKELSYELHITIQNDIFCILYIFASSDGTTRLNAFSQQPHRKLPKDDWKIHKTMNALSTADKNEQAI